MRRPVLFLTVGLPGSGKTTAATRIAERRRVVRLTPDDWMAPLFGHHDAEGRRDVVEGRLIWVAHEVLRSGAGAVLDFGCWSPEERWAIRAVGDAAGAEVELVVCEVDEAVRRERCRRRWIEAPGTTFEMSDADHDTWASAYQAPSRAELVATDLPSPPPVSPSWGHWAAERWPTLPVVPTRR